MTESGKNWASQVAELHAHDVEIVIRAFCDEVELKASRKARLPGSPNGATLIGRAEAFDELKRELLGDVKMGALITESGKNWSSLIVALLPLITNLTPVLIAAIQRIKAQGGLTTEQIIAQAGVTLDENDRKLIEDLIRLGVI